MEGGLQAYYSVYECTPLEGTWNLYPIEYRESFNGYSLVSEHIMIQIIEHIVSYSQLHLTESYLAGGYRFAFL